MSKAKLLKRIKYQCSGSGLLCSWCAEPARFAVAIVPESKSKSRNLVWIKCTFDKLRTCLGVRSRTYILLPSTWSAGRLQYWPISWQKISHKIQKIVLTWHRALFKVLQLSSGASWVHTCEFLHAFTRRTGGQRQGPSAPQVISLVVGGGGQVVSGVAGEAVGETGGNGRTDAWINLMELVASDSQRILSRTSI